MPDYPFSGNETVYVPSRTWATEPQWHNPKDPQWYRGRISRRQKNGFYVVFEDATEVLFSTAYLLDCQEEYAKNPLKPLSDVRRSP